MPLWQPTQLLRKTRLSPPGLRLTSWRMRSGATRRVLHLLEVAAHVIHQREAEHRAVRAVDEERLSGGARGDHAGRRVGRQAVDRGLRRLTQHVRVASGSRRSDSSAS